MRMGRGRVGGNLLTVVFTTAIQYGGEEEYKYVWEQYMTTQTASERKLLLMSLTKTNQPHLIQRLLNDCLDENKIKAQDAWGVIRGLAGTAAG